MERKEIFTIEELNAAVRAAVNAAMDAREKEKQNVLLSREAVAKRLQVNVSTLWRWDRSGYLKATRVGRKCVYSEDVISKLEKCGKKA